MSPTWQPKPEGWKRKTEDMAEYQRAWRKKNKKKVEAYEAKRKKRTPDQEREKYARHMRKLHGEDWAPRAKKTEEEKLAARQARDRRKRAAHPEKIRARKIVQKAVARGAMKKLPCSICGVDAEAHHPDYEKPRDVIWLCPEHHREVHAK